MIEAINRKTLKFKIANSDIEFAGYHEYERMQDLIDSCAELHVIPVGYIEMWITQHRNTSGIAGYYLRWMMEDYKSLAKETIQEDDFTMGNDAEHEHQKKSTGRV